MSVAVLPRAASKAAEIALNGWILSAPAPAVRACWGLDHIEGKWRIGLSADSGDGRFVQLPAATHADYAQCITNAIEIAHLAGYG
jgi:hypothetical protein